jgi:hypothetical protein
VRLLQAIAALASERATAIAASSQLAGQQLGGAVQQLQGSQQSIAAAAADSDKADAALATQLAGAATKIGEEATGGPDGCLQLTLLCRHRGSANCCKTC